MDSTPLDPVNAVRADLGLPPSLVFNPPPADEQNLTATAPPGVFVDLPLEQMVESPTNVRRTFDEAAQRQLEESIRAVGRILSPLLVREQEPGLYEIVSGHRRFRAAKALSLSAVPCNVVPLTNVQALEIQVAENVQRQDLTPLEEADACLRLSLEANYSAAQIAERLGQSKAWALNRLRLGQAAPEVRSALEGAHLEYSVALELARLPTHGTQAQVLSAMRKAHPVGADVGTLRTWIAQHHAVPLDGKAFDLEDETLVPEAGSCVKCPFNSANDAPDLFTQPSDSRVCRAPDCARTKSEAAWDATAAKHAKKGKEVLSLAKSRGLWRFGELDPKSPYIEAKGIAFEDAKKRTWAQLMGEAPEDKRPGLSVAYRDGKAVDLYHRAQVLAVCADVLKLRWAKKAEAERAPAKPAKVEESDTERQAREALERAQAAAAAACALKVGERGLDGVSARLLLDGTLVPSGDEAFNGLLKEWGWSGKGSAETWLQRNGKPAQLLAVAVYQQIADALVSGGDPKDLCRRFGVDWSVLLKRAGAAP